jgi:ELWxxDGT repeat protein
MKSLRNPIGRSTRSFRFEPAPRRSGSTVVLRTEALEDRLLLSLVPTLLLDINVGSAGSNPQPFAQVNNLVYFAATDQNGRELWATDGTAAGTFLVKDINRGTGSSNPQGFTNVSGTLFFRATDGTRGVELWESNGTAAGTFLVKDINPGASDAAPVYITNVNGSVFFFANDGVHGFEPWVSNGSAAGTFLLKEINPGTGINAYSADVTNVNGILFFAANDGTHGTELWESNGSAAGTVLVKDINPGTGNSYPRILTNVNGILFFQANDGTHGLELWESNGSAAGTFMVQDINPGTGSSHPAQLTNVNGTLFFFANDGTHGSELWESNGSAAGTFLVQDINPGANSSYGDGWVTNVNGSLFFQANDGTHGKELWASNGSPAGTSLVRDINSGLANSSPAYLTNVNGTLFFAADDGSHGTELWASNGSAVGTFLVQDINPVRNFLGIPYSSNPSFLRNINGTLLFAANDGFHGSEPWILPVSTAPTTAVSSSPNPSVFGQVVAFTATVSGAFGAGTPTGTVDFTEGGTDLTPGGVSLTGGQATFTTAALAVGSHTITAAYSGDSTFSGSQGDDSASPHLVNQGGTSTSLASAPDTSVFGQPVGFIAFVAAVGPGAGTPTGSVTFEEGATTLAANVSLSGGRASFSTASLSVGSHTVTAFYSGDGNFLASSASSTQDVADIASSSTTVGSTDNPSMFGQAVTFTAAVAAVAPATGTPTGTVSFTEGATTLAANVALAAGIATFTISSLSVGSHTVTATYNGDVNFQMSAGDDSGSPHVVNQASSTTSVSSAVNPSGFGQTVTFAAVVAAVAPGAGTPGGTVTFTEGAVTLASSVAMSFGQATFTTSSLSVGSHTITALYSGDNNFSGSQGDDSSGPHVVNQGGTNTSLAFAPATSVFGQSVGVVAFVAAASPASGTPTGSVTFQEGSTVLAANVSLSNGHASLSTASLPAGSHTISAFYSGDGNFLASSASSTEVVSKAATGTALTSSVNPAVSGQKIVFRATVSAVAPGTGTPTGTVDFKDGATDLTPGGVTLSGGEATFSTTTLAVGSHTITALYSGDADYTASQVNDAAAPEVVNKAGSHTVLTASPNPAVFGQVVSFTVLVRSGPLGSGTPTGTVTFLDGTTTIGSMTLNSAGRATFTTASLSRGDHAINANYSGDGNFLASTYTNFGEPVLQDATTTTVTSSANPAVVGTTITFTASVVANAPGAGKPTGTVTFKDITTVLGASTLNAAGQATFTTSALAVGTHAITASYAGDTNFLSSFSPNIAEVVKASVRATFVSPSPASSSRGSAAASSLQSVPLPGLNAQSVDNLFTASGGRRRLTTLPAARPHAPVRVGDWLDLW